MKYKILLVLIIGVLAACSTKPKQTNANKAIHEKEIMFEADYGKLLPFDMETELEKKGANLKRVDKETRSNGQIIDSENRIITASSATGGEFIAEEIKKTKLCLKKVN